MSDKYGYIGIETLLDFCSNDKNHCVTPNDFMRMNRVKIDERPHGEWIENKKYNRRGKRFLNCSVCHYGDNGDIVCHVSIIPNFCPNCGADMRKEGEEK